jgi:hypothetical protein
VNRPPSNEELSCVRVEHALPELGFHDVRF